MSYDAVPQDLKDRAQWVTWRYEKEGRPVSKDTKGATKIPYNAKTGHKASSTNANTWTEFDAAVKAAQARRHDGIGFVFSGDDPFTGIDLDDCLDDSGALAAWAQSIVETMASYTEVSPSGHGLKIWVIGDIPSSVKTPQIEMYSTARYFTVTGQRFDSTPAAIRNVNGALTTLYESVKPESAPAPQTAPRASVSTDEHTQAWARQILARAIAMVTMATDGIKHDTLLAAARLAGGAIPHISETEIETALYAAIEGRADDKHGAQRTIRDGIRMGMSSKLDPPDPQPQPTFDSAGFACCPNHARRLSFANNGNGYTCRARDRSTASGWCDFWWKGAGYLPPQTTEPVLIAGELIAQAPIDAPPVGRYVLYDIRGLRALPPITWLIPGEIPDGLTTIICGPSGAGKSFLSLDYAIRIARQHPDRAVVYIAPEGGSGYRVRVDAWLDHFGGDEPDNLVFLLQAVPILNAQAVNDFIETVRSARPIAVVIDTLARCIVGGDENSAKDVGVFFYHTDLIRQETSAAIIIVHHTGKSGAYRGSSSLIGSVESWIDVANDDGLITVSCGKSKDDKPFPPRYLRMVEVGESVILLPSDQVTQRGGKLTEGQRKTLETLALDIFTEAGAKRTELEAATGINSVTMYKVLSRLKRDRLISQGKKGDPYFITESGLTAIKNYHRDLRQSREQLSNYQGTINQLSPDDSTNYPTISPYIYREIVDSRVDSSEDSELFPEDTEPSRVIDPPPALAHEAPRGGLDWDYLQKVYASGDEAAIKRHCTINRQNFEMVMEQLRGVR